MSSSTLQADDIPIIAQLLPFKNFTGADAHLIPPSGPSPTFMSREQLLKVAPAWLDVMIKMVDMPAAHKVPHA